MTETDPPLKPLVSARYRIPMRAGDLELILVDGPKPATFIVHVDNALVPDVGLDLGETATISGYTVRLVDRGATNALLEVTDPSGRRLGV